MIDEVPWADGLIDGEKEACWPTAGNELAPFFPRWTKGQIRIEEGSEEMARVSLETLVSEEFNQGKNKE